MTVLGADTRTVSVLNDQGAPIFRTAHFIQAKVLEDSQLMRQPLEDGAVLVDHRILNPTIIELLVYLEPSSYVNVYQQIRAEYLRGALFSIQTRAGLHTRLMLASIPREERAEDVDLVVMNLSFEEVLLQAVQFQTLPPRAVRNPTDASTVKRGEQRGGSTLYKAIYT